MPATLSAEKKKPQVIHLKDYREPDYQISSIELYFDLREEHTRVRSRIHGIRVQPRPLVLNGEDLKLISIKLDGRKLSAVEYRCDETTLTIEEIPEKFVLEIETEIEPQNNKAFEGLYKSRTVFCTQCEAQGFRKITYFLDRPDVMLQFTTTIEADKKKYPFLLSNGNPISRKDLSGGRHQAIWEDPFPKPCYLFALVAGGLGMIEDHFSTMSGRKITLQIFVDKGNEARAQYAMDSLKRAMKWDEETFGREYDLDLYMIVAVDDFNFGAMENKGLNIFNSQYVLANPETATDQNFQGIEGVIGHEYFHNWTGNRVTCRDWFQITLKEGLTVFRDQEFSSDMTSRAVKRIEDVRFLKDYQFVEDAGPNAHPIRPKSYIEVNNFYTSTVYQKGSEVIRMIHTLIGKENFRKGMDKYFELYDGKAVTTDDFVHAMELVSGMDLTHFRHWYDAPGTPICRVSSKYSAASKTFELTVTQHPPQNADKKTFKPYFFPLKAALLDSKGKETDLGILVISKRSQTFSFKNIPSRPVPSLLRNFSAPVKIETDLTREDLVFLLANDTDPVNRCEAAQTLMRDYLKSSITRIQKKRKPEEDQALFDALGSLLRDQSLDPAFAVEALIPPSEVTLNEALKVCDFESVHAARHFLITAFARKFKKQLFDIYERFQTKKYAVDSESIGKRSFKNLALRYLTLLKDPDAMKLLVRQFRRANNMTDALSALSLLCESDLPEREEALKAFYLKWKKDPLVMNKWFAVQASSRRADVLDQIKRLEKDPAFDSKNPNKQRSLYTVFTMNLVRFHDKSGSGYKFIADKILEIDRLNPGAAGKLSSAFKKYAHLDLKRKALMRSELNRILKTKGLSKDVFEILSKTLKSGNG
ncbi:MAG: aminopeptidase N [Candidatus Omnitrophica bacterium]|nr:aminopeptidase N [Candidatus Omnitrophota bacterium]